MAKLADALDLGSSAARRAGSTPASRITFSWQELRPSRLNRLLPPLSGREGPPCGVAGHFFDVVMVDVVMVDMVLFDVVLVEMVLMVLLEPHRQGCWRGHVFGGGIRFE